jgi:hypothetical protein
VSLHPDGTVLTANGTFLRWLGREPSDVVGQVRLPSLFSVGGRIYWETHLAPLLHAERRFDEVALELKGSHGRLPVLLSAVVVPDGAGADVVQVAISSARERSRYERELLAARAAADASAARAGLLLRATAALSGAADVGSVTAALLRAATGSLGAAAGTVWVPDAEHGLRAVASLAEDRTTSPRPELDLSSRVPQTREGRVVVPLHGISEVQGVLSLAARTTAAAEPLDLDALSGIAQQAGLALDRATLYERSANVAHELQQSLLSSDAPQGESFVVTTTYRPGVVGLEVGGDWYDSFLPQAGVLSVVVGDVVGKGLGAASRMGQLRSAVRAVAGPGVGPAALLNRLDHFVGQVPEATSTTLAYGEIDLATGCFRYACAGHLPPVLVPAASPARLLWDGRSTPLGVSRPGRPRTDAEVRLQPGDQVLLYTDGLVERRDRTLPDRLQDLVTAADDLDGLSPSDATATLMERLVREDEGHDDVCLLLLTWRG